LALDEEARQFEAGEVADTQGIITIDGALTLLDSIPTGAWAIVTSGSRALATARLQSRGLPMPPTMVTADDVVNGKPHPEPYMTAARLLGLSADDCIVVEDAPAGLAAATAAGMRSIGVASTHASDELTEATVIARELRDIQVTAGTGGRLVVNIGRP
jgi:sugar-phosphatase